jgi:hypothetical protein
MNSWERNVMNKSCSLAPILVAVLLLLPVLYLGSYIALVDPYVDSDRPIASFVGGNYNYRYGGRMTPRFFWPIEQIDRQLRPHMWRPLRDPVTLVADPSA